MFYQRLDYANPVTFVGTGKLQENQRICGLKWNRGCNIWLRVISKAITKYWEGIEGDDSGSHKPYSIYLLNGRRLPTLRRRWSGSVQAARYPDLPVLWTHPRASTGVLVCVDRERRRRSVTPPPTPEGKHRQDHSIQRKNRGKMVRVALVGYTNVGKINPYEPVKQKWSICRKQVVCNPGHYCKVIIDNLPFLLSDTVGFIRKLPTELVVSFKPHWMKCVKPICCTYSRGFRTLSPRIISRL